MGVKGDKLSGHSALAANALVEKLQPIGGISSRKMFGGYGIFHESKMFGIIDSKGNCYFKVDDSTREEYEKMGSQSHGKMPYYSIPGSILHQTEELIGLAQTAINISKN